MVNKLSRRDALKVGAVGVGGGLLSLSPFAKKKQENDMTIHIHSFNNTGYVTSDSADWDFGDTTGAGDKYPGLVFGISIFDSSETVTFLQMDGIDFAFVRADTNGLYRSEVWHLANIPVSATTPISIGFSDTTDFVVGACCYLYFGGIGNHEGTTGTSQPLAESPTIRVRLNSILFSNLCINEAGGAAPAGAQNNRWEVSGGSDNHGLGSDAGPFEEEIDTTAIYQTSGTPIWALSAVELLDYQDNPSAISGT